MLGGQDLKLRPTPPSIAIVGQEVGRIKRARHYAYATSTFHWKALVDEKHASIRMND